MSSIQYANIVRQAQLCFHEQRHVDAREACAHLLNMNPKSPEAISLLAEINWEEKHRKEAIDLLKRYVRHYPKDIGKRVRLAQWLHHQGDSRGALSHFDKARRISPDNPKVTAGLAHCYIVNGENKRAERLLKPIVDSGKENYEIAIAYTTLQSNLRNYKEVVRIGIRHVNNRAMPRQTRCGLLYRIGLAFEKLEVPDKAFEAFKMANDSEESRRDTSEMIDLVKKLMQVFSRENVKRLPRATTNSELPVFVVSRPRSGSTMIERIIAAHPEAHAAGEVNYMSRVTQDAALAIGSTLEYPDVVTDMNQKDVDLLSQRYLDNLRAKSPTSTRITDKYLGNWKHLGAIQMLVPNAKVIDLRRSAVDNCFACYTSPLGSQHPYSTDLREVGIAYRAVERLMKHWSEVLDIPILRVNYEDVVQDQEPWTRRIIDFCGLSWHDDCLQFHKAGERSQKGTSPTLSYSQVRQPMYKSSIQRAAQFEEFLKPLHEGLAEGQRFWQQQTAAELQQR